MAHNVSRTLLVLCALTLSRPALAATWETVSQETQEFWVPDVVSTRSIVVTEPVYDWVAEEPWRPVVVLAATAAVVIQQIPASQVRSVFGAGQSGAVSSGGIKAFQGQRSNGGVSLTGLKSREVLGADRAKASSVRSGQRGQSTLRNGGNSEGGR